MTIYSQAKPAGTPTWIDLATPEMDAARAFYHAVFGWDYDISGSEFGGYTTAPWVNTRPPGLEATRVRMARRFPWPGECFDGSQWLPGSARSSGAARFAQNGG